MKHLERKQATRRKIELGGLIVKAGLHEETAAVILGLLLEAKEQLESKQGQKIRQDWQIRGSIAFATNE